MSYLYAFIILLVACFIIKFLVFTINKDILKEEWKNMILKVNRIYGIIGFIGITLTSIAGIITCFIKFEAHIASIIFLAVLLFIWFVFLILILIDRNQRLVINEDRIIYYDFICRKKLILWKDIKKVRYSKIFMKLTIYSDSCSIPVLVRMIGFDNFVELMKEKLSSEIYVQAVQQKAS